MLTCSYRDCTAGKINIAVYDASGRMLKVLVNQKQESGTYTIGWNTENLSKGVYYITASTDGSLKQTIKLVKQ